MSSFSKLHYLGKYSVEFGIAWTKFRIHHPRDSKFHGTPKEVYLLRHNFVWKMHQFYVNRIKVPFWRLKGLTVCEHCNRAIAEPEGHPEWDYCTECLDVTCECCGSEEYMRDPDEYCDECLMGAAEYACEGDR